MVGWKASVSTPSWPLSLFLAQSSVKACQEWMPAEHSRAHAPGQAGPTETLGHTEKQRREERIGTRWFPAQSLAPGPQGQHSWLTRNRIFFMLKVLELRRWSARRPGVAITTCGFRESSRACTTMSEVEGELRLRGRVEQGPQATLASQAPIPMPPTMIQSFRPRGFPSTRNCSAIW